MDREERFLDFMDMTTRALGRIEEGIKNNSDHTLAVSRKADMIRTELQDHVGSSDAHGSGGERRASEKALQVVTAVIAVTGLLMSVYKWGHG